jgi:hypothetical protein
MPLLLATPSRRIGLGILLLAWSTVQFLMVARDLHFLSRLGLGVQVGIAAALIYSGMGRHGPRHA